MIRWLVILTLSAAPMARADTDDDGLTRVGIREFNAAYLAWDAAGFLRATALFREASVQAPDRVLNFYWMGASEFHRMVLLRGADDSPGTAGALEDARESAMSALEQAIERDPAHAECHALLGTVYGMKIEGSLMRALRYGRRVQRHRVAALKQGADNPRVMYLLGTGQFHTAKTAAAFRETLVTLRKAEALFQAEKPQPVHPLEPRWGFSSCLVFIGLTFEQLDQPGKAGEYFQKALQEQPLNHMARAGLERLKPTQ